MPIDRFAEAQTVKTKKIKPTFNDSLSSINDLGLGFRPSRLQFTDYGIRGSSGVEASEKFRRRTRTEMLGYVFGPGPRMVKSLKTEQSVELSLSRKLRQRRQPPAFGKRIELLATAHEHLVKAQISYFLPIRHG